MSDLKNKDLIIKLFQQFLENKLSAKVLVDKWPNKGDELEPSEEDLLHELDHYISDTDIHEKEPEYKEMQLKKIQSAYNDFIRV